MPVNQSASAVPSATRTTGTFSVTNRTMTTAMMMKRM